MAARKLDMGAAWNSAAALIAQNKDTVGAIIGLFFFVPSLAVALFAPDLGAPDTPEVVPGASPDAAVRAMLDGMSQTYADNWPLFLGVTVVQFVGSLTLLALLGNRDGPTVGEALRRGLGAVPSYFAAQLLAALAASLVIGIPLGLIALIAPGPAIGFALFALLLVAVYLLVKFSLIAPVIAIEGTHNPIKALARSWRLTKGNSLRIATFLFLLFITIGIVTAIISLILGLVFALFDKSIADIGNGIVSSLINAVVGMVFLVVLAAVHEQLAGPSDKQLASTFE
ncbi:MAG: glycerophosphoryl diester phosphodiesterase membrane domain-containing protein [Erythrobacter sp.]